MTLPFLGLIMSILHREKVKIPSGLPLMKREDPISTLTVNRSKACLQGNEEEAKERAQGEDTTYEGGDTDEEIDNFTLDPEDMEASPSQAQP